ncbi:MAG: J domain-containing protein [Bacteroidia bacterium]
MFIDYYDVLGVDSKANLDEIKAAYRELALQYHPDSNPDDLDAHDQFILIGEAYSVLSDPLERKKFHHRYLTKAAPTIKPEISSYDITRMKRAARYPRGRYSARYRHRAKTYQGPTKSENKGKAKKAKSQGPKRPEGALAQDIFSDKYREEIRNRRVEDALAYNWFSKVMLGFTCLALVFSLVLLLDYYLPAKQETGKVVSQHMVAWSFANPGIVKINTPETQFTIGRSYANYLLEGKRVVIDKTYFGDVPVSIETDYYGQPIRIDTWDSIYGGMSFFLVYVLLFLCIGTLYYHKYNVLVSYAGTSIILLSLIMISML